MRSVWDVWLEVWMCSQCNGCHQQVAADFPQRCSVQASHFGVSPCCHVTLAMFDSGPFWFGRSAIGAVFCQVALLFFQVQFGPIVILQIP